MRNVALRAWLTGIVALGLAGAGMTSLAAGSTVTSLGRMAVAAGILSGYATAVALLVTPRAERTWRRCLWWGGLVSGMVAGVTVALVAWQSGSARGVLFGLPWLVGSVPICLVGRYLPELPRIRRRLRPTP